MQSICTLNLMLKLGSSFPFKMGMLFLIWRELGMGKFPHSWLSSHSETEFLHSRLRRSWRNTLSLFLLSHSWGNFFSRLRGFATQGGKIPSLILSRREIGHFHMGKFLINLLMPFLNLLMPLLKNKSKL